MTNEEMKEHIGFLLKKLDEAEAEIERLSLDVKILVEELEHERRPKRDER